MMIKCYRCHKFEHRHDRTATIIRGICSTCRNKRMKNKLAAIYYGQRPRGETARHKGLKIPRR